MNVCVCVCVCVRCFVDGRAHVLWFKGVHIKITSLYWAPKLRGGL